MFIHLRYQLEDFNNRPVADSSYKLGDVMSLTNVVINVDQLVKEVFDRGHAAKDDRVKRCHPLLFPVTQLEAQVPNAL